MFWQSSSKATVAGVRGAANVDGNRFDGSVTELKNYSRAFVAGRASGVGFGHGVAASFQGA